MAALDYPKPAGDYLCYELDEEISFGKIDIPRLPADWRANEPGGEDGAPLFQKGAEFCADVH